MAKTIEFTAKNVKPFSDWLKKFASIEKSLLMEVDEENKCFVAKSYNEEKSVVKYSKISFIDAGFSLKKDSKDPQFIKAGIYNIPRIIKSLEHFLSGEFSFAIQYDEVLDGNAKGLAGIALLIKSPSLKIKIECTSLNIFKYISDDLFKNAIAKTEAITSFEMSSSMIEKINSLCDLDKEYKFLEYVIRDKKVFVRGRSFELELADDGDKQFILSIYKDQFNKIDIENYNIELGEDKLIFRSKDSDTITVTSMVVKDEKYEEESMKF